MRDVHLDEIISKVAAQYDIPKRVVKKLTTNMIEVIFRTMKTKKDRVLMFNSDMPQVYTDYDVKAMCMEMIDGKRISYDRYFHKRERIPYRNKLALRRPRFDMLD